MKKFKLLLSLILVLLLFLSNNVFAKTKINFWYSVPEEYNIHMKKLIDKFNDEHQYYQVLPKNFQSLKDLKEALDGDSLPDVAIIDACWQNELIKLSKIISVEDLMNEVGSTIKIVFKMDTFSNLWESCVYNDKIWSLPFYVLNQALIYDSEFLKEKKIKFPPKSWAEVVKFGKILSSPENGLWGFLLPMDATAGEIASCFQVFLWQAGGEICDSQGRLILNDTKAVKTLSFLRDLIKKHRISPENGNGNFEKVAMRIGTCEDFLKLKAKGYDFKVAPLPVNKKSANEMKLSSLAIFKTRKEVEPAKCWYFVYWLSEFPQASFWALNTPYLPANKQVTLSPGYFSYLEKYPEIRIYLTQLKNSRISYNIAGYDEILVKVGNGIKGFLAVEDVSVEETLDKMNNEINSVIDRGSFDSKISLGKKDNP